MASEKENTRQRFTFRREWYEMISMFDDDVRLELYEMIMDKVFHGEVVFTHSAMATAAFKIVSFQIDNDFKRAEEIVEKRRAAGIIGGKANGSKWKQVEANESKTKQMEAKEANASHVSQRKNFVKPTIEEVKAYIAQKGYHFDAEQFFAFYESKGWKVGNQPMKDWKMACVTWEGRAKQGIQQKQSATQQNQPQQQPKKTFTDWNSTEALTEQYKIDEERRKKIQEEEEREQRIRSFQVQILDYYNSHKADYKTLAEGEVKENEYFTVTGLPDGTMYWNCKKANCRRRTYYHEFVEAIEECPLDAPMRPKRSDERCDWYWDKQQKIWMY